MKLFMPVCLFVLSVLSISQVYASVDQGQVSATQSVINEGQDPYAKKYGITLGASFPTGPVIDLTYRPIRELSFGLSAGGLNIPLSVVDNIDFSSLALESKTKWYPFGAAFFLGVAGG